MAPNLRRGLTLCLPLLVGIVAVTLLGGLLPAEPVPLPPGVARHTLDRGGTVRWDNGKADVTTVYRFELANGNQQVPLTIGNWQGLDFGSGDVSLLTTDPGSILPEVIVNRLYHGPDGDVAFAMVGSDTTRKLHRPEICYVAANWEVREQPNRTIKLAQGGEVTVNQFWTRAPSGEERVVAYSFIWGDTRRRIEDGAFIMQIGSPIRSGEGPEVAGARVDRFFNQIVLHADPPASLLALGR